MRDKHKKPMMSHHQLDLRADQLMPTAPNEQSILHARALQIAKKREEKLEEVIEVDYIKFRLGQNERYGIPFSNTREVIKNSLITHMPFLPDYIDGVINHRGFLLSILNLRRYFQLTSKDVKHSISEIIVVSDDNYKIGLFVDCIEGADHYEAKKLDPALTRSKSIKTEYIIGLDKGHTAILNINAILDDVSRQLNK